MLTFSWTGKRKKRSDASEHGLTILQDKHISSSDHDCSEPSVSRSTTSTGSINFGQNISFSTSIGSSFKEAEYSGRLLLHGLRLQEFPTEAFNNINLLDIVLIDISDNRLTTVPNDFAQFDCLISCIARRNRFRTIPTSICYIDQLTYIDFSFNEICHLPDGLFDLPLSTLILSGNKIQSIPEAVRSLGPTLKYLDLSKNELQIIPMHLRFLNSLKVLNLSKNFIKNIPDEICSLLDLRSLDVSNNFITHLPQDLVKLIDLKQIKIASNPLQSPPIDVAERGIVHILKWLEGRTSGGVGHNELVERKQIASAAGKESNFQYRTNNDNTKSYSYDNSKLDHANNRQKEIVAAKFIHPNKPSKVQVVNNKLNLSNSPIPQEPNKYSTASDQDEQNNNRMNTNDKQIPVNASSPGMTKKPISKVAPMIKGASRPSSTLNISSNTNGNIQSKATSVRRSVNASRVPTTTNKRDSTLQSDKTARKIPSHAYRKQTDLVPKSVSRPITGSSLALNRSAQPANKTRQNDIEHARKILNETLGTKFTSLKSEIGFSSQLSDGIELCKFVNKLQPSAIVLATTADSTISTMRSKLNAERFVQYCKKLGLPETSLCTSMDILTKRNPQRVAKTIISLTKVQSLHISPQNSIECK